LLCAVPQLLLHFTDVAMPELANVCAADRSVPLSYDTLSTFLEPFYTVMTHAIDSALVKRVRERVFDALLSVIHYRTSSTPPLSVSPV
jgi:hypothetical protein